MIPRPRFKLPAWLALAIVLGAFAFGRFVRGGPPLDADALVLLLALIGVGIAVYMRRSLDREADEIPGEGNDEHRDPADQR